MKRRKHDYFLKVARSLGACQLVEFELKFYIAQSMEVISKFVDGRIPFKMMGRDYENKPLGELIEIFNKLSDNSALAKKLERFKKERNFVAHKAIAECLDPDGGLIDSESEEITERLRKIEKEAAELTEAIHEQSGQSFAHLYFDAIDEGS
jgi:hypothetical protein